jgi:hypothetical protein
MAGFLLTNSERTAPGAPPGTIRRHRYGLQCRAARAPCGTHLQGEHVPNAAVESAFLWLQRPGFAPAALYPPHVRVPKPLEVQELDGGALVWLPLALLEPGRRALAALPPPALLLFPPRDADVPRVMEQWLALYEDAPKSLEESVLQVVDDVAHLRPYLDAEDALWQIVWRVHPHKEDPGVYPRALAEARWLCEAVLDHPAYAERAEFLSLAAFETVARELLLVVRQSELKALRDHLRGVPSYLGW